MSFFKELRRRNVIRMAGLYLVGAWLLTQVAGTVLPMFGAPDWLPRSVVVLLALGFVPMLVFAWVFEITPEGIKRDADIAPGDSIAPHTARRMNRMIVAVLVLAVTFFAFDRLVLAPRRDAALVVATTQSVQAAAATTAAAAAVTPAVDPHSIAVLPFVNMSEDKDNEFFSDGISEELLNALVRVEGLGVASRTSSFAFKGKDVAASEIAGQLKVRYILEGSVRKHRDAVRITAQLIDASDDRHVWSETFDRKLTDIFKIQDEIANAIVTAVRGSVGPGAAAKAVSIRADTDNMQAYEVYLKARELFLARRDLPESIRLFEQVTRMDPGFARGWEGQAAIYAIVEGWGIRDRDYSTLARDAAHRALALDASLSMPWAALSSLEQRQRPADWDKVLEMADKAIAADPNNATALLWRSIAWTNLGFFAKAVADQKACLAIDPNYANCERWQAAAELYAGHDDRARALFEQSVARGFVLNRSASFVPLLVERREILAAYLLLGALEVPPGLKPELMASLRQPGRPVADVNGLLDRHAGTEAEFTGVRLTRARAAMWLGDFGPVAADIKGADETVVAWEPRPIAWRNSPGFKRLLRQMGIPAYWRKHEFPPHCRALGRDDFICDKASP